ncbi:MAG: MarR family winged helix-turn-helix transcriptional regulator [Rhizomicrobium sp.]
MTQFTLLAALALRGPKRIGELASFIGIDRTTLTRNVAVAAKQSLVRVRAGRDARSRIVSITATGQRTLKRALPVWSAVQSEVTGALGEDAAHNLRRIAGSPHPPLKALSQERTK